MSTDRTADYNILVVEKHLGTCETCTEELRRQPALHERLDKRVLEAAPLTEDEVHRIVSQPEAGDDTKALPTDE
jgi:predicted anti-sigma-YlaC factor YlaD